MMESSWRFWSLCVRFGRLLPVIFLCACETTALAPPTVDRVRFVPAPEEKRTINEPSVRWLLREDASEYCARILGLPNSPTARVIACAFWNVPRKTCGIVTAPATGVNYLGHELRHCFEGPFHG